MKVYDLKTMQITEIRENTVVALGTFDGFHLGHASVFKNAFYEAKKRRAKSVVYTFLDNPKSVAKILTLEEKLDLFKRFGIDYVALDSFEDVKTMSGEDFVSKVLVGQLCVVCACCGFNYRFGSGASKNAQDLKHLLGKVGGSVEISERILIENETLSSTKLRKMIENGQVGEIQAYMPPYSIYARVEHGKKLGREMGFPTINQSIPQGKVVPKNGVYITECYIGEDTYPSITNVGVRPTVDNPLAPVNMETHIIGYNGFLYGSYIKVVFREFVRNERKFESLDELKKQIAIDIEKAKNYFI
ncbi:MAG: riboflavin biosynthesis protein RibF [Clostridia bacterium]|nr:riboflavin biosynthesis protein RibF [Clostridia bacterium]